MVDFESTYFVQVFINGGNTMEINAIGRPYETLSNFGRQFRWSAVCSALYISLFTLACYSPTILALRGHYYDTLASKGTESMALNHSL